MVLKGMIILLETWSMSIVVYRQNNMMPKSLHQLEIVPLLLYNMDQLNYTEVHQSLQLYQVEEYVEQTIELDLHNRTLHVCSRKGRPT